MKDHKVHPRILTPSTNILFLFMNTRFGCEEHIFKSVKELKLNKKRNKETKEENINKYLGERKDEKDTASAVATVLSALNL